MPAMRYLILIAALAPFLAVAADDSAGFSKCRKDGGTAEACTAKHRPDAQRRLDQQKATLSKSAQETQRMNDRLDKQYQQIK